MPFTPALSPRGERERKRSTILEVSQVDGARPRSGRPRNRLRKFLSGSFVGVAAWIVRFVCATLRVRTENEERFFGTEGGKILCTWHGRPIPPAARLRNTGLTVLISLSRDGDFINTILGSMGYDAIRGSSGPSGARAAAACLKLLRAGKALVVTPDGPRGPSGILQPGVITMAQKSGCALIPIGSSSRPRFVMKSWDRMEMPLPFARALILFGEPVYVPKEADAEALEEYRLRLQSEMRGLQDEADRRLRQPTFGQIAKRETA
ncbi:DUF374 domain-containing protein [bacterium]|nr:MAG: DUF374 domain-containing protein [bacterium]